MFKLPDRLPSRHAGVQELADYAEFLCWRNGQISSQEISRYLVRIDDNDINEGCEDTEDIIYDKMDDVFAEIQRREKACTGGYPFIWKKARNGQVLCFDTHTSCKPQLVAYIYLLLSTRLNMSRNHKHAELDGALLLEHLSTHVLKTFLGSKSRSMNFGTATGGGFRERLATLCRELGEGGGLRDMHGEPVQARDGGLDIVGWIPFADEEQGKLIVFRQCKTGTEWHGQTSTLQPLDFAKKWLGDTFPVEPMRAHFVAESIDRGRWRQLSISAGLLVDLCRRVEYAAHRPAQVAADRIAWTGAVRQWVPAAMRAA